MATSHASLVASVEKLRNKNLMLRKVLQNLASHPLYPVNLKAIAACRCPLCGTDELLLSSYPFKKSPYFSRLLLLHCESCGLAWVDNIPFDLTQYYESLYANDVQPFRKYEGDFFSEANPFWETDQARNYLNRTNQHIRLLGGAERQFGQVMDYGCGIGITLHKINATAKYACELDKYSQEILRQNGIGLVESYDVSRKFDVILASHSLEHLMVGELSKILGWFREALSDNGRLLIEVPNGFTVVSLLSGGQSSSHAQEPHTIFFTSYSLYKFVKASGFEIVKLGLCEWTRKALARTPDLIPGVEKIGFETKQPVLLAKRR